MKRLLAALFLGLLVALVGASGVASADPPNDFTTGGAQKEVSDGQTTLEEKFAFSAQDEDAIGGPNGVARSGHYVFERTLTTPTSSTTVELEGSVSCVWVQGHRALFKGPIEKSNDPALEGRFAQFIVEDNDQPPVNGAVPDRFFFEGTTPNPICPEPASIIPLNNITSGNILVSDAQ
jgi:hypothetical protein